MSSARDRAILECIINPLLPLGENIGTEEGFQVCSSVESTDGTEQSPSVQEAQAFEKAGVQEAENGSLNEAIQLFSQAIQVAPEHASGYNNRAQALRLLGRNEEALLDLHKALQLCNEMGPVACQAFAQRASIYKFQGKDDLARQDFQSAAQLGSAFAKSQLVQMNPYAAMCNKMLHDVMSKLRSGEGGD